MTERVVIDDKMICAVREAQERDAEDERRLPLKGDERPIVRKRRGPPSWPHTSHALTLASRNPHDDLAVALARGAQRLDDDSVRQHVGKPSSPGRQARVRNYSVVF
jgi:hypothetical protein